MKGGRPALRYAKALLSLAKEKGADAVVNDNMLFIASTISQSEDLTSMLNSPVIKLSDKKKVLTTLFSERVNDISLNLFTLLEDNKRMEMLEVIAIQYNLLFDKSNATQVAKVTTAVALTPALEEKILAKIVTLTGNKASIENIVDPTVIGGFILRIGDLQYDASISNHFNELRKEFDKSHYVPQI